jgi:hypothetical protein
MFRRTSSLFLLFSSLFSQIAIQGYVYDRDLHRPIGGALIQVLMGDSILSATFSDTTGYFLLQLPQGGRVSLKVEMAGYKPYYVDEIIVSSRRPWQGEIHLSSYEIEGVTITGTSGLTPVNEMALLSVRPFSVRETERYAGSRGDPSRMASNFAGVQGADDSRNDLIVRGNSPLSLIWRMNHIYIPNPNHFAIPGTNGGPISLLNNQYLANSDFYNGAMPSEFGNGTAAAFDLYMRNPTPTHFVKQFQLGLLGTELLLEGPLSKRKQHGPSFLLNYRYSTLQLFHLLRIPIGTNAIPFYQDGAFRLTIPSKKGRSLAFWGISGTSRIDIVLSTMEKPTDETLLYGDEDRDQYFRSSTALTGFQYLHPLTEKSYFSLNGGFTTQIVSVHHDKIFRHIENGAYVLDSLVPILGYRFQESSLPVHFFLKSTRSSSSRVKVGIHIVPYFLAYLDTVRQVFFASQDTVITPWRKRWDDQAQTLLLQPYIQWAFQPFPGIEVVTGFTGLYYSINVNSFSPFEPRLSLAYHLSEKAKLKFGTGLYSQTQPHFLYFFSDSVSQGNRILYNKNLGLTKSIHLVTGYEYLHPKGHYFLTEIYYQYLFNIPIEKDRQTPYSLMNAGTGFSRIFPPPLVNKGVGRNMGIEFTFQKPFNQDFFYLFTLSLFNSQYQGSDGRWYNSTYNGNFILNLLGGYAFQLKKATSLILSTKVTWSGSRRYGDIDTTATVFQQEVVFRDNENFNRYRFPNYFRWDVRINWIRVGERLTHEIGLDLINLTNQKNILTYTYVPNASNPLRYEYQLGFLPIFFYRINF